jgi:hypothetical protein
MSGKEGISPGVQVLSAVTEEGAVRDFEPETAVRKACRLCRIETRADLDIVRRRGSCSEEVVSEDNRELAATALPPSPVLSMWM